MLRDKKFSTAGLLLATLVLLGILVTWYEFHGRSYRFVMAESPGLHGPIQQLENEDRAHERITQRIIPGIVYLRTEHIIRAEQSPLFSDPMLRQFFGNMLPQIPRSSGSTRWVQE